VVIDSFTSFSVTCVTFQLDVRSNEDNKKPQLSKGGLVIPDFDEYKGETTLVTQALDVSEGAPVPRHLDRPPASEARHVWSGRRHEGRQDYVDCSLRSQDRCDGAGLLQRGLASRSARRRWSASENHPHPDHRDQFAKTALPLPEQFDVTMKPTFTEVQKYLDEYRIKLQEKTSQQQEGGSVVA
jgi:hypothetical protein